MFDYVSDLVNGVSRNILFLYPLHKCLGMVLHNHVISNFGFLCFGGKR